MRRRAGWGEWVSVWCLFSSTIDRPRRSERHVCITTPAHRDLGVSTPEPIPRPDWFALPRPGCHGVDAKVLLNSPELVLALLRFGPNSTIDEHPAPHAIDVICLEGDGFFSVAGEPARLHADERVQWPPNRHTGCGRRAARCSR